ncbi:hypothetical protein Tco_1300866 [Tanacetum coccineum]
MNTLFLTPMHHHTSDSGIDGVISSGYLLSFRGLFTECHELRKRDTIMMFPYVANPSLGNLAVHTIDLHKNYEFTNLMLTFEGVTDWYRSQGYREPVIMSSATSAVTYTSVYTDSEPGRAFWGADDEEAQRTPQTPIVPQDEDEREPMFVQAHDPDYVPEPIYPEYIQLEDDPWSSAEEQPLLYRGWSVDYPMDGGDDGDDDDGDSSRDDANDEDEDEEEEHLTSG